MRRGFSASLAGAFGICVRQDDHELVAAEAARKPVRARGRAQRFSDGLDDGVAGLVADEVVDVLEAVEVDEQDQSEGGGGAR